MWWHRSSCVSECSCRPASWACHLSWQISGASPAQGSVCGSHVRRHSAFEQSQPLPGPPACERRMAGAARLSLALEPFPHPRSFAPCFFRPACMWLALLMINVRPPSLPLGLGCPVCDTPQLRPSLWVLSGQFRALLLWLNVMFLLWVCL